MNLSIIKEYEPINSILDVGANVGKFYQDIKNIFPDAYYYLIEANPECSAFLQVLGIDYHIGVLSDSIKPVTFYTNVQDKLSTGASVYRENTHHFSDENVIETRYEATTLDTLLPNQTFDLIKLDVQGSELDIIKGGPIMISNCKLLLLELSCLPYNQNAPLEDEVINYLRTIGFVEIEELGCWYNDSHTLVQRDVLFLNTLL